MPATPWRSCHPPDPRREYLVLLSFLPLKRRWRIPWLLISAFRIVRQLRHSSGLMAYSLYTHCGALLDPLGMGERVDLAGIRSRFTACGGDASLDPAYGTNALRPVDSIGHRSSHQLGRGATPVTVPSAREEDVRLTQRR